MAPMARMELPLVAPAALPRALPQVAMQSLLVALARMQLPLAAPAALPSQVLEAMAPPPLAVARGLLLEQSAARGAQAAWVRDQVGQVSSPPRP
mmetsp:Transcript_37783/g.97707  ORF Transcript_37783/g.97707 Transcript_37783/m.97707 type:complete len:94 (-) Transcript_37783:346-627(-)